MGQDPLELSSYENHDYQIRPELREYFGRLPIHVKTVILASGAEITTLGELMQIAEHLKKEG